MASLFSDVPYAWRQLRKSPAFTLTAILTLGLGIGVNAAMFSVIDQVLLRGLPYRDPSRLVEIGPHSPGSTGFGPASLPDVKDWKARSHSLADVAYWAFALPTLGGTENPQQVAQISSSTNLFELLGVNPRIGRAFLPEDAQAGKENVVVLSAGVWNKVFHSDPNIVGRSVPVNGEQRTVIGVMPPSFDFPVGTGEEIFSPLVTDGKDFNDRGSSALGVIGRLRPGVPVEQAQRELESIHQQLLHEYSDKENGDPTRLALYRDAVTEDVRPALLALNGAVIAVWLIACANVAGLMLTRTSSRYREIAIRGALGAGRLQLAKQFLTESLLLSGAGGLAGLGVAWGALRLLQHYLAGAVLHGEDIHINATVCGYLLLASCLSAVLFSLAPAWHAAQTPVQDGLRESTTAAGTSKRQVRLRDSLVVGEIALTLTLLIAAGLMVREMWQLRHTRLGFVPEKLVTASMFLPTWGNWWAQEPNINAPDMVTSFYRPLMEKLQHTPGVQSVAVTTVRPMDAHAHFNMSIEIVGQPKPPKSNEPHAYARASSANFFTTMGIRLLKGRYFNETDTPDSPQSVIVNQTFVDRILPGQDPLGKQINMDDDKKGQFATIVGVIEDSRQDALSGEVQPEVHFDLDQVKPGHVLYSILAGFHMDIAVRTQLAPSVAIQAITRNVHALQPQIVLQDTETMQQVLDDSLGNQTLAMRLLSIFSAAALAIAAAGIYGLLAYSVSQRTRELGLRIALGAQRGDVLWLVLRHALVLLAIGVAVGLAVAWGASGVMRSFVYGVHEYDAATIAVVVLVMGACSMAASYLPARRAANVDPMEALRSE